jgi:hypothetical protein
MFMFVVWLQEQTSRPKRHPNVPLVNSDQISASAFLLNSMFALYNTNTQVLLFLHNVVNRKYASRTGWNCA